MKYYHVIYNSSEKGVSGSSGFGVRSVTEGAPPELTSAMADAEMFSFDQLGPDMVPSALQQNPDLVLGIPPQYFFGSVTLSDKSRYYVLGRKIAVGFDYSFYKNGKATRPGNYVVDAYAFDTLPGATEFEILLENAAHGSRHFIPASPAPCTDNEEMRGISLEQQPVLPYDEIPFNAMAPAQITPRAFDVLFAFIQSRKTGKPLLIKTEVDEAPRLMAALARLLPPEMVGDMSFLSDYSSEGKKKGVNIYLINRFYDQEVFESQWTCCDFTAGATIDTPERKAHGREIEALVAAGDFKTLYSKVRWCMSDMFDRYRETGPDALAQLYNYFHDYDNFAWRIVAEDDKFRAALCECFRDNPREQERLDRTLQSSFDNIADLRQMLAWMTYILRSSGVDFTRLVEANKSAMTAMVLQSPENFLAFRSTFRSRYDSAMRFIDKEAYNNHLARNIADERYSELFEAKMAEFRTDTPDRIRHLVANLCAYSSNPAAAGWSKSRGAAVFRNLYAAMLEAVKTRGITAGEAVGLCQQLCKSRLPESVYEPFVPLGMLLSQTESGIESRLPQIFDLAAELGMNPYLSRIALAVMQSPGIEASRVVPYFLDNGIMTEQRLMVSAKKLAQPQKYWIEVLRYRKLKPQQMLDLLCDINGLLMDDATAMDFLSRYFPEAHARIEKSRRPSIFDRMKSMFFKKNNQAETNDDVKPKTHK